MFVTSTRRQFITLTASIAGMAAAKMADAAPAGGRKFNQSFELSEVSVAELGEGMKSGKYTAKGITELYLERIHEIDTGGPGLNSVIEINPDAVDIAAALDRERRERGARSGLHGIPVLIKDNIATHDRMMTTAGSLVLYGSIAPRDSHVAAKLREAGAVILGKTNLSEWANFRGSRSTSGWSGRGGLTNNPYAIDRNPSGSSSGSGVAAAASLSAATIGTETDGSIISPSSVCGIVGLKPTVGLIGRSGIIPISHTQDTAGPMARTVMDAAILLGALTGIDERDAVTKESAGKSFADYTQFLDPKGFKGARIGVARDFAGFSRAVDREFEYLLVMMKNAGAELIDPVEMPTIKEIRESEFEVMLYEFKAGLNAYFAGLGPESPVKTIDDVILFNDRNYEKELRYFGQETLIKAAEKGTLEDADYKKALAECRRLSRDEGIDRVMNEHRLDALVSPTSSPASPTDLVNGDHGVGGGVTRPAAVSGYPHITLTGGYLFGLPFGISFFGRAYSEPVLLRLAYAFEQATKLRQAPSFRERADLKG